MKKLKLLLLLFLAINLSSCEDLFDGGKKNACANYEKAWEEYSSAVQRFAGNPTSSNCSNFKSKASALLRAAKKCSDASSSQIAAVEEMVRKYNCNQFN